MGWEGLARATASRSKGKSPKIRSTRTPDRLSSGRTRVSLTKEAGSEVSTLKSLSSAVTTRSVSEVSAAMVTSMSRVARGSPQTALARPPMTM